MLSFFHKYQRAFFIFVTALTISSFMFFGMGDVVQRSIAKKEDKQIGKRLDGSTVYFSQLDVLTRFLSSEVGDLSLQASGPVNLCNDGVISIDFLQTNIANLIVDNCGDTFQEDLALRLDKARRFKGYEHFDASFVSSKMIWNKFSPQISENLDLLKSEQNVNPKVFEYLSSLYRLQKQCPPELLKFGLQMMTKQYSWIKPDPRLQYADLSLLGFHSVGEWFGSAFIQTASKFIMQTAAYAVEKGFHVTSSEARADLERNFALAIEKYPHVAKNKSSCFSYLQSLGIQEEEAVSAWTEVLLFRKYFKSVGDATFVDKLAYLDFAGFAKDARVIQEYHFPEPIHLQTLDDLISFQVYLHALGMDLQTIDLPKSVVSIDKIQESFPLLVHTDYKAKFAKTSLSEIGLWAPMQEIFALQMQEDHQKMLLKAFSFLEESKELSFAQKLANLTSEQRKQVDAFSRNQWAESHEKMACKILDGKSLDEKSFSISRDFVSLEMIQDKAGFIAFLHVLEGDHSVESQVFKDFGGNFYKIAHVELTSPMHVLSYESATSLDIMSKIADNFMQKQYEKIRGKYHSLFQVKEGEWKLFSSVKEDLAKIVFKDLFKKIGGTQESLAYYAKHRLEHPCKEALRLLKVDLHHADCVLTDSQDAILDQFKLVAKTREIQRTTKDDWMKEQVFIMTPKNWSPVFAPENGDIAFFYFENEKAFQEPIFEQISFGKEVISSDAKCFAAKNLLLKIKNSPGALFPNIQKEI